MSSATIIFSPENHFPPASLTPDFFITHSRRARGFKAINENLLSSFNPYFRSLYFPSPGSSLRASPDTEGSAKPLSRQG